MAKKASAVKAASIERPAPARPPIALVPARRPKPVAESTGRAASVFVSYSRVDQLVCDQVVRELKERGHAVWRDREAIHGGQVWRASIERGIRAADVFVILLSPGLLENPDHTREELEFARKHHKTIVAVWLRSPQPLPDGFDLILGGREFIELDDFDRGMQELFEALGGSAPAEPAAPASFWDRAVRKVQRVRAVVANSDLGPTALKLGAAALASAAAVVVTVATINEDRRRKALRDYRAAVEGILEDCVRELKLTETMTAERYARESRPRVRFLLGRLDATPAPGEEVAARHAAFVKDLAHAVDEYDQAVAELEHGDVEAARRAVARFAVMFSRTLKSHTAWLDSQR
jgi:hypothetical protein